MSRAGQGARTKLVFLSERFELDLENKGNALAGISSLLRVEHDLKLSGRNSGSDSIVESKIALMVILIWLTVAGDLPNGSCRISTDFHAISGRCKRMPREVRMTSAAQMAGFQSIPIFSPIVGALCLLRHSRHPCY